MSSQANESRMRLGLVLVLALGLLIRLPWLATDWRVTGDLALYKGWVRTIQTRGLLELYDGKEQLYPPLTSLMFGAVAQVERWSASWVGASESALHFLLKLPPTLADIGTAALIAAAVWTRPRLAVLAAALYLFNPAVLYNTAFWGQLESLYVFFGVAALVLFQRNHTTLAWASWALGVGIKVQAVALAPVLVPATFAREGIRAVVRGALVTGLVLVVLTLPWWLNGALDANFFGSMLFGSRTARVDVSGYNLWYMLLRDGVHTASSLDPFSFFPLSFRQVGFLLYGVYAALIAVRIWRGRDSDLSLAAALSFLGLFMLLTDVHERYLFPVAVLLLLAAAQSSLKFPGAARTRWLWLGYALVTLTLSFNLITIAQPALVVAPLNLVAQPTDSVWVAALKTGAFGVAILNACLLVGLSALFWKGTPSPR